MYYEFCGRIKEVECTPTIFCCCVPLQMNALKIVPDTEYTVKIGNQRRCLLLGNTEAKLLFYQEYVKISFSGKKMPASLFSPGRGIRLVLESPSQGKRKITVSSDQENNGQEKGEGFSLREMGFLE